jgi:hypothetical protein
MQLGNRTPMSKPDANARAGGVTLEAQYGSLLKSMRRGPSPTHCTVRVHHGGKFPPDL